MPPGKSFAYLTGSKTTDSGEMELRVGDGKDFILSPMNKQKRAL
jgi:hypothetical protein